MAHLRVVYRTSGSDTSGKGRHEDFSKLRCLRSFCVAAAHSGASVRFLVDGVVERARMDLMESAGEVHQVAIRGNSASFRFALDLWHSMSADDILLMAEDDYMWHPDCLSLVEAAVRERPSEFFSPYDHPDRYRRTDDWFSRRSDVLFIGGRHWRQVESTTMTVAATVGTWRRGRLVMDAGTVLPTPKDRYIWRALGVLRGFRPAVLTPIPALAMHMEEDQLSPGIDLTSAEWRVEGPGTGDIT